MQINIKVSSKLISTLWASKFPTRWYYHYWWAWSSIPKVLKVLSLQYLSNISKKEVWNGVDFLHADKNQTFCKFTILFLMVVVIHVQNMQSSQNAKHSDILWGSSHVHCYLLHTDISKVILNSVDWDTK